MNGLKLADILFLLPCVCVRAFRFAVNNFDSIRFDSIHARKSIRINSSDSIRLHITVAHGRNPGGEREGDKKKWCQNATASLRLYAVTDDTDKWWGALVCRDRDCHVSCGNPSIGGLADRRQQPVQSNRTFRFFGIDSNRFANWIESNLFELQIGMFHSKPDRTLSGVMEEWRSING